jgi:hypothetical protein
MFFCVFMGYWPGGIIMSFPRCAHGGNVNSRRSAAQDRTPDFHGFFKNPPLFSDPFFAKRTSVPSPVFTRRNPLFQASHPDPLGRLQNQNPSVLCGLGRLYAWNLPPGSRRGIPTTCAFRVEFHFLTLSKSF